MSVFPTPEEELNTRKTRNQNYTDRELLEI